MSAQEKAQLQELITFLDSPNPQVRKLAVQNILPYTATKGPSQVLRNVLTGLGGLGGSGGAIESLKKLTWDEELIAHDALSALINLTDSLIVCKKVGDERFVTRLVSSITDPNYILADLGCMLLSNLTKLESISETLLRLPSIAIAKEGSRGSQGEGRGRALDDLVETFVKGESKKLNKNADYDFLSSVFANVSTISEGRNYLSGRLPSTSSSSPSTTASTTTTKPPPSLMTSKEEQVDEVVLKDQVSDVPLTKLQVFTEHPSTIRRGGVASCIKNSCFVKEAHPDLLSEDKTNILPYVLLPLCGPEEFDLEDQDQMPSSIQFLPGTKTREKDPHIRLIHLETLLLLSTTYYGREHLRQKRVYVVVRTMHEAEKDEQVIEAVDRLVNLLMRDESDETKREELGIEVVGEEGDEDELVQEV